MPRKYERLWTVPSLKSKYDVVIIGGGLHGLATAYYLARDQGITDVAVVEKRYIGFGGAGRNTAIVRANQRTKENLPLYLEGLRLWPELTKELDFNLMFFNCGNLNLAHSEAAISALRMQVVSAQFFGIKSELLDARQCKELIPTLDISDHITNPILGGMYHPPGCGGLGLGKGGCEKGRPYPSGYGSSRHRRGKWEGCFRGNGQGEDSDPSGLECGRWLFDPHRLYGGYSTSHRGSYDSGHGDGTGKTRPESCGLIRSLSLLCASKSKGGDCHGGSHGSLAQLHDTDFGLLYQTSSRGVDRATSLFKRDQVYAHLGGAGGYDAGHGPHY
jgi:hypothetical protein